MTSYGHPVESQKSLEVSSLTDGTWYWNIRANNGYANSSSDSWKFVICQPVTIGALYLSPESGYVMISQVYLSWNIACAYFYIESNSGNKGTKTALKKGPFL